MLLPALSKAKQRATTAACLNAEKQLGLAWIMYSDDNMDMLVNLNTYDGCQWKCNRYRLAGRSLAHG